MYCARVSPVVLSALVLAALAGCGGTLGRSNAAERLPADGSQGGPSVATLKVQDIAANEWASYQKKKLAPTCDARGGDVKADKAGVDKATAAIAAWTDYLAKNPKPPKNPSTPTVGDVIGLDRPDGSRTLTSLAFACATGQPATISMSATAYTFDLAWVYESKRSKRLGIQAISLKDKKVYYASISTPTDPKAKSEEIAIVTNVARYLPDDADEPLVVANESSMDAKLETFVASKGKTQGFYFVVPSSEGISIERFLGVGAFAVRP